VARKRQPYEGKLRTREHIIADLSVNYVERQILLCGFVANRIEKDYGIDLLMYTFTKKGELENGDVRFQLKATDKMQLLKGGKSIVVRAEVADLKWWKAENMPVILVLYHATKDRAYWLYIQQYLEKNKVALDVLPAKQSHLSIHIPVSNRLGKRAIAKIRKFRNRILDQVKGTLNHGG
jgi:hypothetical protein